MTGLGLSCLDLILAPGGLTVLFQPIVERRERAFALRSVEAVVRGPKGSNVERAEVLFDYVRRKREEARVDRACVAAACAAARGLPPALDVSVNVHTATLAGDPGFVGHLLDQARSGGIAPPRLTVEIVEHAREWARPAMLEAIAELRRSGVRIALDDIGLGRSNYRMVVDCKPDQLKVDRFFARRVHVDPYRRAVFQSVQDLAAGIGAQVVAEGIEDRADLETLACMGISLFQGFLFLPPVPASDLVFEDVPYPDKGQPVGTAARA